VSETVYRFEATPTPGVYRPFHRATETRVPGEVIVKPNAQGQPDRFTFVRDIPPPKGKRKHTIIELRAATVAELSEKLDKMFTTGEIT
jgi:hypothetical protein